MRNTLLAALVLAACSTEQVAQASPPAFTPSGQHEVAIVAGGCFWGMENVMRQAPGILKIEVGYAGGKAPNVGYEDVASGTTGYAESVRIVFDPKVISYADLLTHWYFRGHDPTQLDHQNNDVGTQYRSEIFVTTPEQARVAWEVKSKGDATHKWGHPIVTRIEPATTWVKAEDYHQDYLLKNPNGYNDHYLRKFDF
jgi:methionine-S-sulfoxide reductase